MSDDAGAETDRRLRDYRTLLRRATEKFDEIHARRAERMACGAGCADCCAPGLTVCDVERENVRAHVASRPGLREELLELEERDPNRGTSCSFLKSDRTCSIYPARPLVCRTHGAPLFFRDDGETYADVCPKNFEGGAGLETLEAEDFLNLDLLNQTLAAVNRVFAGPDRAAARTPLKPSQIL